MSKVQTVEVLENQDIVLTHNGKVVGLVINSTITINGVTAYDFTGRAIDHVDISKEYDEQNQYRFGAGTSFEIKSNDVADFIRDHVEK